ncbi:MAG: polyphenol oxidase family protein [Desulfovibrio sp.]|nr:polyphenol oxidase family protein [Desulfovibrio sp.]
MKAEKEMTNLARAGLIPFVFPGVPNVLCAFGSALSGDIRLGGGSDDDEKACAKRRAMLAAAGLERWVELDQIHEDGFIVSPTPTPLEFPSTLRADGACNREKDLALLIKSADCQPLFLALADGSAVAALHVGWRGNTFNYPAIGLKRFCETCKAAPGDVRAVRGPSLGPKSSEFINFATEWPPACHHLFDRTDYTIDLWQLTHTQLVTAGMKDKHIFALDLCTQSLPGLLFSYRRGDTARQGSMIWIRGDKA